MTSSVQRRDVLRSLHRLGMRSRNTLFSRAYGPVGVLRLFILVIETRIEYGEVQETHA